MKYLRKFLKCFLITISPSFAMNSARKYWISTSKTHGNLNEEEFNFYFLKLKEILSPRKNEKILDFGGGNGEIAYRFKLEGFNIEHYDISLKMREKAKTLYGLYSLSDEELPNRKYYYDKILVNNVFFYIHPKKTTKFFKFIF
jgi:2-polyprenyl-3-methyl-5-hydroxy-6-metoxy-1,4-benzoquinol methylase